MIDGELAKLNNPVFAFRLFSNTSAGERCLAAAGWRLAHKQGRRDDAVKQSEARSKHNIALRAQVIRQPNAWIEIIPLSIQHARRPGFKFPAQPAIQSEL